MSKAGTLNTSLVPAGVLETLTGNSGGAVGPDGSSNINVVGDGTTASVVGNPVTNTLTISSITPPANFVLIQSQDATSGTSKTFSTGITSSYHTYMLIINNLFVSLTGTAPSITVNSAVTAETYGINFSNYNTGTISNVNGTNAALPLAGSTIESGTGREMNGYLYFYNLSGNYQFTSGQVLYTDNAGVLTQASIVASWAVGVPITSITISVTGAMQAFSGGNFSLYGIT